MFVHAALLMVLALITLPEQPPEKRILAVANASDIQELDTPDLEDIDLSVKPEFKDMAPSDDLSPRETPPEMRQPSVDDIVVPLERFKMDEDAEQFAPPEGLLDRLFNGEQGPLQQQRGAERPHGPSAERGWQRRK